MKERKFFLRGKLTNVGDFKTINEERNVQAVDLTILEHSPDDFGKDRPRDYWVMQITTAVVEPERLNSLVGKKVKCACAARPFTYEKDSKRLHGINVKIVAIEEEK